MTDEDVRLGVICAVLNGLNANPHPVVPPGEGFCTMAMKQADKILELWRDVKPYAPDPKCVHGLLFTENCVLCTAGVPIDALRTDLRPIYDGYNNPTSSRCGHGERSVNECMQCAVLAVNRALKNANPDAQE